MSDLAAVQDSVKDLVAEWARYKTANDKAIEETKALGFESAEQKERFAKMDKEMDGLEEFNEKVRADFEKATELKSRVDLLETALRRPRTGDIGVGGDPKWSLPEYAEHKALLDKFLRYGSKEHTKALDAAEMKKFGELETKVLRTASDPDGGYFLTPQVEAGILERVTETSPMRQIADVTSIVGDTWEQIRELTGASGGGWVGEQGTRSETTTPTFGKISIVVHEQFEEPRLTQKMLDDAGFEVESYLSKKVEEVMINRENTAYFLGTGVAQPRGIMTYTDGTDDTAFEVEQVPSLSATTVTADGLINCQEALLEPFQPNARWLMRRSTWGVIRRLKSGQGNYMLNADFSTAGAASLLGKPVLFCADIAAIAGSALVVAYGDFRQAYKIVDRIGIRVLRDPYTAKPYIKMYTTKRTGGGVIRPQAYKIMDVAAS